MSAAASTFRSIRIGVLLAVLALVAYQTWYEGWASKRWRVPLYVGLYPIAADDSPGTQRYLAGLEPRRFEDIDRFFAREAGRHHLGLDAPFKVRLRAPLTDRPPQRAPDAGVLATALFSLELRWWASRHDAHGADPQDIRIYVLYHDPERTPVVPHSLGLSKGLLGVVYAFASARMDGTNDVVIAHELLHTLGATDKYDPATDAPRFPDGYGDEHQQPLYPQRYAELMAGRRALSARQAVQPESLSQVVLGGLSAREIRWPAAADPLEDASPVLPPDQPSAARTSACSSRLAQASTERDSSPIGAPSRSVKTPPASLTIATHAAMSRMLMSVSMTTSMWPPASRW